MKKADVSLFAIGVLILALIVGVVVWLAFWGTAQGLAPEGQAFHTASCKLNSILSSFTFLTAGGGLLGIEVAPAAISPFRVPNIFCKPARVDIDANNCKCSDFTTSLTEQYILGNMYDGDTNTIVKLPLPEKGNKIDFTLPEYYEGDINLTSFKIYIDPTGESQPKEISIKTGKFLRSWRTCFEGEIEIPGAADWVELNPKCKLYSKGKLRIELINSTNPEMHEVNIIDFNFSASGDRKGVKQVANLPPEVHKLETWADRCYKEVRWGGCSDEWKKEWVALKLGKSAASCWAMGLEGKRNPGIFICYHGKITNLPGSIGTDEDTAAGNISKAMEKASLKGGQTYAQYLPRKKLHPYCSDLIAYLRGYAPVTAPASAIAMLLAGTGHAGGGYQNGEYYSIVYGDAYLLAAPFLEDKVFFC